MIALMHGEYMKRAAFYMSDGELNERDSFAAVTDLFTDRTPAALLEKRFLADEIIFFASDIRTGTSEADVAADMLKQRQWAIALKCH